MSGNLVVKCEDNAIVARLGNARELCIKSDFEDLGFPCFAWQQ
jgi:hypothetical protein